MRNHKFTLDHHNSVAYQQSAPGIWCHCSVEFFCFVHHSLIETKSIFSFHEYAIHSLFDQQHSSFLVLANTNFKVWGLYEAMTKTCDGAEILFCFYLNINLRRKLLGSSYDERSKLGFFLCFVMFTAEDWSKLRHSACYDFFSLFSLAVNHMKQVKVCKTLFEWTATSRNIYASVKCCLRFLCGLFPCVFIVLLHCILNEAAWALACAALL